MNTLEKRLPTGGTAGKAGRGASESSLVASECTTLAAVLQSPPRKRRLDPKIGALAKLDVVEHRLHVFNTAGDMDGWARYYLSWLALYKVAFPMGQEGNYVT